MRLLIFGLFILLLGFCTPPVNEKLTEVRTSFSDSLLQQIYDYQDHQQTDSLFSYFRSPDPSYRYAAALAFSSIKDSTAIDSLLPLLKDEIEKVRVAAAYSLGQIGSARAEGALIKAFNQYDTAGIWNQTNAAILEAIGKCGTPKFLEALSTIKTYQPTDTVLVEGQAWGIFRYAQRSIISPEGTATMLRFISNPAYPVKVRLIASYYLYRGKDLDLSASVSDIAQILAREDNPMVRLNLVIPLGRTKDPIALNALLNQYNLEPEIQVKANILRALANFDYESVKALYFTALNDPNYHISRTAAQFFVDYGQPVEARNYWEKAKDSLNWETQVLLYTAANRHTSDSMSYTKGAINQELRQRFEQSTNPYEKAATLTALGEFGWNYRNIKEMGFNAMEEVVRTACMEAIAKATKKPEFRQYFGISYRRVRQEISNYCVEAINKGDVGMMAIAAEIFREPGLNFRGTIDSLAFLENAMAKLELPRDIETFNELKKTLDFFQDKKDTKLEKPAYNHPIDWTLAASIQEGTQVTIETTRGKIVLELWPDFAPGTVANFVSLLRSGFYDDKAFHRVVTNFVIQGGCPRGDGYGSLDYSIRSELPYLHYDQPGLIGMASSGNHTECTQFFITHAPALHLDGNYTIFGKVVSGMEVVNQIRIGDRIEKITIQEEPQ
ncbi:MAG: peptidylprolyl isomerase [Saprospirales bacterium]|nr:peptidylprolyl isomerase [Saprospirales bacterium]MBK8493091.1 peptidylprolyl isomerase [Saprospirales bacterium]